MESVTQLSGVQFLLQGGVVTITVGLLLMAMSIASWYFVVVKLIQTFKYKRELEHFTASFWASHNAQGMVKEQVENSAAARLTNRAIQAAHHHETYAANNVLETCGSDEFLARAMRRNIAEEQAVLESGLSVLASVGSVAPFVGLFGTVWGIYHALIGISASGQATLDKVAGPVGEALIMTALGLAVAIPAVLAYNGLVKSNRDILASLDSFAQDLHITLTTGARMQAKLHSKPISNTQLQQVIA